MKTAIIAVTLAALTGISATNMTGAATNAAPVTTDESDMAKTEETARPTTVTMETSKGTIVFDLLWDKAPATCENFVKLAKDGYYDGLTFHRVIPGFMIQGGCPYGSGTGGPGYTIDAEFNNTKHVPGVVSMARTSDPNSAGSQFFICVAPAPHLDGQYTAFGTTTEGVDVAVDISEVERDKRDTPTMPVTIKSVTVK